MRQELLISRRLFPQVEASISLPKSLRRLVCVLDSPVTSRGGRREGRRD